MHDNQQFHWLYGIEEIFNHTESQFNRNVLKSFIEVVLRGNMSNLEELLMLDSTFNSRTSPETALLSYWYNNASNKDLMGYLAEHTTNDFLVTIYKWMLRHETSTFNDHFSRGQMQSKLWLIHILKQCISNNKLGNIALYGGWHATINHMLNETFDIKHTYNLELEEECILSSTNFNIGTKFTAIKTDVSKLKWTGSDLIIPSVGQTSINCVINTSCEHMDDSWYENLPKGQFVVMQSNDFFDCDQHVNCVKSIEEMLLKYPMHQLIYSGELDATVYNRFMIIGMK